MLAVTKHLKRLSIKRMLRYRCLSCAYVSCLCLFRFRTVIVESAIGLAGAKALGPALRANHWLTVVEITRLSDYVVIVKSMLLLAECFVWRFLLLLGEDIGGEEGYKLLHEQDTDSDSDSDDDDD